MFTHTAKKTRPDRASLKRRRRGVFACSVCGQPTSAEHGTVDTVTGTATCSLCLERALETGVSNG
jgi:transcription elongation factor Elf1